MQCCVSFVTLPFGEGVKICLKKNILKQKLNFFLTKTKSTISYHVQHKFRNYVIYTILGSEIILFLDHKQNFNCFF